MNRSDPLFTIKDLWIVPRFAGNSQFEGVGKGFIHGHHHGDKHYSAAVRGILARCTDAWSGS